MEQCFAVRGIERRETIRAAEQQRGNSALAPDMPKMRDQGWALAGIELCEVASTKDLASETTLASGSEDRWLGSTELEQSTQQKRIAILDFQRPRQLTSPERSLIHKTTFFS